MTIAVVTGGTRGIGLAIARRLATDFSHVIAAARTPAALPPGISYGPLDVTDPGQVRDFFAGLDRVDVLVNNAGLAGANALDDLASWHAILATNLTGTFLCSAAALERMPDATGRIVNIASTLGLRGVADQTAYCAAKHGVIGFTRALALAVAPRGITVNAVCPGWVATDMAAQRFHELGITPAQAAAGIPTGRLTTPEQVADAVAFLARGGNITGQVLAVDGGTLAAA